MLDAKLRPLIDPPLNSAGKGLAKAGFSANAVTMIGLISGLAGAFAIYSGIFWLALLLIISNRILDGLDGAIARVTGKTAFGGYLDIVCDFIFYISVPLSFGFADPQNMPYALALVSAFTLTGVSFLAYATIATQHGLATDAHRREKFLLQHRNRGGCGNHPVFLTHVPVSVGVHDIGRHLYRAVRGNGVAAQFAGMA